MGQDGSNETLTNDSLIGLLQDINDAVTLPDHLQDRVEEFLEDEEEDAGEDD